MDDESGAWLRYAEAGDRLGVTPEAARAKAARKRWRRQIGNDGLARVWLPGDERPAGDLPVTTRAREPGDRPVTPRSSPDRKPDAAIIKALGEHVQTLKEQLAATEARLVAADASLAAERAQTEKAIDAFRTLADRLDQLAADRARPWWRRLVERLAMPLENWVHHSALWPFLYDWQTIIAGFLALLAAVGTIWVTRHIANRQIAASREEADKQIKAAREEADRVIAATRAQTEVTAKQTETTIELARKRDETEFDAFRVMLEAAMTLVIARWMGPKKPIRTFWRRQQRAPRPTPLPFAGASPKARSRNCGALASRGAALGLATFSTSKARSTTSRCKLKITSTPVACSSDGASTPVWASSSMRSRTKRSLCAKGPYETVMASRPGAALALRHQVGEPGYRMVRIAISQAAFDAIAKTPSGGRREARPHPPPARRARRACPT